MDSRKYNSWEHFRPVGDDDENAKPPASKLADIFYTFLALFFMIGMSVGGMVLLFCVFCGKSFIMLGYFGVAPWRLVRIFILIGVVTGVVQWVQGLREDRQWRREQEIRKERRRRRAQAAWRGPSAPPEEAPPEEE